MIWYNMSKVRQILSEKRQWVISSRQWKWVRVESEWFRRLGWQHGNGDLWCWIWFYLVWWTMQQAHETGLHRHHCNCTKSDLYIDFLMFLKFWSWKNIFKREFLYKINGCHSNEFEILLDDNRVNSKSRHPHLSPLHQVQSTCSLVMWPECLTIAKRVMPLPFTHAKRTAKNLLLDLFITAFKIL